MTAEDLTHDAPSIFTESRSLMEEVLDRRQSVQSAPDYIAPDTPFWRLPRKTREKQAVKWEESPPEEPEVAKQRFEDELQGVSNIRPRELVVSPSRLASKLLDESTRPPNEKAERRAARDNPADDLISTLRQRAVEYAETGVDPDLKESLEQALAQHPGAERAARLREMRACVADFETLVLEGKVSVANCNELIRAQALQGRMGDALKTVDAMQSHGYEPDDGTFVSLMMGASKRRDAAMARRFFLMMRERLIPSTLKVYTTLMKAHVRAGDVASCRSLLRKMDDDRVEPDVAAYTVWIDGLVNVGKLEMAWDEFHSARTWKLIQPDEVLFTVMIKACAKAEEAERALNMLDDMRMCGLYPTDMTYGSLMHAMATTPDHANKAFDFFRQMQAEDMPLSPFVFEKLLQACRALGDVTKGKDVVRDIQRQEIEMNPAMYYHLVGLFATSMGRASALERTHNLRCAWHVVADARKRCSRLDWTRMLNEVMRVYIAGGFNQFAVDMLAEFPAFDVQPNGETYGCLLDMFGKSKDVGRFFALWENVPHRTPELYHIALEMALDSRSAKRTCSVLEAMLTAQVFPTPQLTDRLAVTGRNIIQIHLLVARMIEMNKDLRASTARRDSALLQTRIDERELELANIGLTSRNPSPAQEARSEHFESLRKRGFFRRPWLSKGEWIASKVRGGEAYSRRHDKPRPNLLAA